MRLCGTWKALPGYWKNGNDDVNVNFRVSSACHAAQQSLGRRQVHGENLFENFVGGAM